MNCDVFLSWRSSNGMACAPAHQKLTYSSWSSSWSSWSSSWSSQSWWRWWRHHHHHLKMRANGRNCNSLTTSDIPEVKLQKLNSINIETFLNAKSSTSCIMLRDTTHQLQILFHSYQNFCNVASRRLRTSSLLTTGEWGLKKPHNLQFLCLI